MWNEPAGGFAITLVLWLSGFFAVYFVLLTGSYITFFLIGVANLRKYRHYVKVVDFASLLKTSLAKPVSLLVPAFNEERNIRESVRALLTLHYPQYEVIVINDGSSDHTLADPDRGIRPGGAQPDLPAPAGNQAGARDL